MIVSADSIFMLGIGNATEVCRSNIDMGKFDLKKYLTTNRKMDKKSQAMTSFKKQPYFYLAK